MNRSDIRHRNLLSQSSTKQNPDRCTNFNNFVMIGSAKKSAVEQSNNVFPKRPSGLRVDQFRKAN